MPEDILRYRVEIDQSSLQSELSKVRATVSQTLSDAVSTIPGAFNQAQYDIASAMNVLQPSVGPIGVVQSDLMSARRMFSTPSARFGEAPGDMMFHKLRASGFDAIRAAPGIRNIPFIGLRAGPSQLQSDLTAGIGGGLGFSGSIKEMIADTAVDIAMFKGGAIIGGAIGTAFGQPVLGAAIGTVASMFLPNPFKAPLGRRMALREIVTQAMGSPFGSKLNIGISDIDDISKTFETGRMMGLNTSSAAASVATLFQSGVGINLRTRRDVLNRAIEVGQNLNLTQRLLNLETLEEGVDLNVRALRMFGSPTGVQQQGLARILANSRRLMMSRSATARIMFGMANQASQMGMDPLSGFMAFDRSARFVMSPGMAPDLQRDIIRFVGQDIAAADISQMMLQQTQTPLFQLARMAAFDPEVGLFNPARLRDIGRRIRGGQGAMSLFTSAARNITSPRAAVDLAAARITQRITSEDVNSSLDILVGVSGERARRFGLNPTSALIGDISRSAPGVPGEVIRAFAEMATRGGVGTDGQLRRARDDLNKEILRASENPVEILKSILDSVRKVGTDIIDAFVGTGPAGKKLNDVKGMIENVRKSSGFSGAGLTAADIAEKIIEEKGGVGRGLAGLASMNLKSSEITQIAREILQNRRDKMAGIQASTESTIRHVPKSLLGATIHVTGNVGNLNLKEGMNIRDNMNDVSHDVSSGSEGSTVESHDRVSSESGQTSQAVRNNTDTIEHYRRQAEQR